MSPALGTAMANDRLRDSLLSHGITPVDLAERLVVDPKTIQRWITTGRTPYRRHRHQIAAILHESESYLWPDALAQDRRSQVALSEVIQLYPHRADTPAELWTRLIGSAVERLDVLVYAGLFLPEQDPRLVRTLSKKARAGTKVRFLLGDPTSPEVSQRGAEEGIGDAIAHKIRNVLHHYEPLDELPGVEIRLHATTLYNSIYRFDDEMLVNMHIHGLPAAHAPLLHLRRLSEGDLFMTYVDSFERVWTASAAAFHPHQLREASL
jgi:hypothetical protein